MALKLEASVISNYYAQMFEQVIDVTLDQGLEYATAISPTDTTEYVRNHEKFDAASLGSQVVGSLVNDTPYAEKIEYGDSGRTFNYYQGPRGGDRTRIYTGVGNRTYQRTLDFMENILIDNILNVDKNARIV